ncbi:hypothetical protein N7457_002802 [Penicillium paradoxum]|uniref:uncharacterized protein n=1 Tax=Penicillium paradoxum TaxID=176176 RepID=UPI0025491440|nr:uncharacterized protein N7457_002802 [Penicillium paradoxum]KAJ5787812.1 hypothetical protein N7457_002802 [Penicillium paradoxum]
MKPDPVSLGSLPVEILCSIFRLLDPIGLISISQTNSKFRAVIQPNRTHLLERLLELECMEEFGGVTPLFRSMDNCIVPEFTDKEWDSMRWTCSVCLRMLPHQAFNNHYLLRLQYRKPIPGSSAANSYTSWESTGYRKLHNRYDLHKQLQVFKEKDRKIRRRYDLSSKSNRMPLHGTRDMRERLAGFQDSGMITFQGFTVDEYVCITAEEEQALLNHEARLIERERCGFKRHLRKCNECYFQSGSISCVANRVGESIYRGTTKVPIVVSRHVPFATAFDRSFPGISAIMSSVRPTTNAPVQRIHRENASDCLWTMYMVRCPRCSHWQELRAFRVGPTFPHWAPHISAADRYRNWDGTEITGSFIDGLSCNHCFAKDCGREKLRKILLDWLDSSLTGHRLELGYLLIGGWGRLLRQIKHDKKLGANIGIAKVVSSIRDFVERVEKDRLFDIPLADLPRLRLRFCEWIAVKKDLGAEELGALRENAWDALWENNYDVIEEHFIWMINCQREMFERDKGDALVDWALNRDGRALT